MNVLHILNDGPCEEAGFIITQQQQQHSVTVVDLQEAELTYEELLEQIDKCDRVFSW